MIDLEPLLVSPDTSIREVMACIDQNTRGIALVVDEERHLIGTVTDGDVRRAILAEMDLALPVENLLKQRVSSPYSRPITAPLNTPEAELLDLMNEHAVSHIPLLEEDGRVMDLAVFKGLVKGYKLPITALIMAGGTGTRLHPLTQKVPKSMLTVGDKPLLELIIQQLRDTGIHRVNVATHHLSEKIKSHFGDGSGFGVELKYVTEDRPLGTAGALSLMELRDEPVLVINGDILTRLDVGAMLEYHRQHRADLTVGVRQFDVEVPYGVLECEGSNVRKIREKPVLKFFVNAGIYLLEPKVCQLIPNGEHCDMTDLIQTLIGHDRTVVSFPIVEYWLDIGQNQDYERAQQDVSSGRFNA